MSDNKIGEITHYFNNIDVGVIKLSNKVSVGDKIRIKGAHTDFEQEIKSMEIDNESIQEADAGDDIAIKVKNRVRENDEVFKMS